MSAILELKSLTKMYGGLCAVDNFSTTIEKDSITGLIGPNGAGKTTLFNMISCTHKATKGKILYDGTDITSVKTNKICLEGIVRTFQVTKPFGDLSLLQNIMVGAFSRTSHNQKAYEKSQRIYEMMGFNSKPEQVAHNLTTVDRKKLEVARALATEPRVLMLDEVMAGCNPQEKLELSDVIRKIKSTGITIIIIEHDIKTIMSLCETVIVLHRGKKLVEGTPKVVANDKNAINAYLGEA